MSLAQTGIDAYVYVAGWLEFIFSAPTETENSESKTFKLC